MPAPAKPKEQPKLPPERAVTTAGTQEQFQTAAAELCEKLGWKGEPTDETVGITVHDAWRYVTKVLHEHFIAGARGDRQPDYKAACEHLSVDNVDEQAAIDEALKAAYDAGKAAKLEQHPRKVATMGDVEMKLNVDQAVERLQKSGSLTKAGK